MKRTLAAFAVLVFAFTACTDAPVLTEPLSPAGAALSAGRSDIIPGRFIVTLREGVSPAAVARAYGVDPDFVYSHVLNGFAGSMSDAARSGLLRDARVARVEPDGIARTTATQTNATWGLDRIDQRNLPLNNTYVYNATGAGVTVYIIDTGIRYSHNEFGGRASFGFDAWGKDGSDCNGHGTHVAGTVAGTIYGVAKQAAVVAVKVLNCAGSGTWSGVIAGMDWVAANRTLPAVANMSLGGGFNSSVNAAVARLVNAGVTTVVAAGNSGADACAYSPASAPAAITIGATNSSDTKASWSNFGSCVDFFAPGVSITAAWHNNNNATNTISGTSMASPHVAGGAALYLHANGSRTPQQVFDALFGSTTKGIVTSSGTAHNHLLYTGDISAEPVTPVASTIAAVSSQSQTGPAGEPVVPPSVIVRDQLGQPMAGVTVTFTVTAGSGTVSPASAVTQSNGTASASTWTIGEGSNTVRASVSGSLFVDFNATGTAAGDGEDPPPAEDPLQASFTYSCTGLSCNFTSTSTGTIAWYKWTSTREGVREGASLSTTSFSGASKQNFSVTLEVRDADGATSSASRNIRCNPNFCQ
jgi:subtilisin family serine protease